MQIFLFAAVLLGVVHNIWAGQICCERLGCYDDGLPFVLFPLPKCPEDMGMNIKVYTRQNPSVGEFITRDIIPAVFKAGVMAIYLVHGWTKSEDYQWLHDVKDAFLEQGDYNVIIVGWKGGAADEYPQAASNTRTVGGEIALIANNTINKEKSSRDKLYCIGHSLGAHVCGHAGQKIKFGRMTGLDPAGILFEDRDWSAGLNPSCADLVDVIHTNGRVYGMLKAVGHIDFYPNGGILQPGCISDMANDVSRKISILVSDSTVPSGVTNCDHARAFQFFSESIRTPCFLSHDVCSSQYLLPVFCTKNDQAVQSMGFYANTYPGRGIFYLTTNSGAPYCGG